VANNKVAGKLPEDWSALVPTLTWLDLQKNAIVGSIPAAIASLTLLTTLSFTQNSINGSIPSGIADLTALAYLGLDQMKLTGVVPPLPFTQYIGNASTHGCSLQGNAFVCPLPPNSSLCKGRGGGEPLEPTCSCTGRSSSLPQRECEWWINFFDTMGGANWTNCASHRTDPCACSYNAWGTPFGVTCGGGHVTTL
jgi:hypothetical protein